MRKFLLFTFHFLLFTLMCSACAFAATDSGLVGYWNFDGDVLDESGNGNNGTWSGSTTNRYVSGYNGLAGTFNGSSDYVDVGTQLISSGNFTFVAWVKPSANGGATYGTPIISHGTVSAGSYITTGIASNGKLQGSVDGTTTTLYSDSAVSLNSSWYHLVLVYDSSASPKEKLFVDGTQQASTGNASANYTANKTRIGGTTSGNSSYMFSGQIDETRIYNKALTADEVYQLYSIGRVVQAGVPKTPAPKGGLVGHWTLDGTANDSSGQGNNGSWSGSSTTRYNSNGIIRQCGAFTSSNSDYVSGMGQVITTEPFTIAFWSKNSATQSSLSVPVSQGHTDSAGVVFQYYSWNAPYLTVGGVGNPRSIMDYSNSDLDWHHVALTQDSANLNKVYLDGVQTTVKETTSGPTYGSAATSWTYNFAPSTYQLYIGQDYNNANRFYNGLVDDVRIYNRALTAAEIRTLANLPPPASGLVGYWNFDGDVSDSSGNSNDGTWSGSTTNRYVSGYNGLAGTFNAANNDYVDLGTTWVPLNTSQPFTVSAWTYLDAFTNNYPIISQFRSNNGEVAFFFSNQASYLGISFGSDNSSWGRFKTDVSADSLLGTWIHVVYTYNGQGATTAGNYAVYKNAVSQTVSSAGAFGGRAARNFIAQENTSGGYPWDGKIDETRIYNRALSADEVYQLYSIGRVAKAGVPKTPAPKGGLVGHWGLDGSAQDQASTNNGTWAGSSTTRYDNDGMIRQAGTFTVANSDYITLGDVNAFDGMSAITISAWAKATSFGTAASGSGIICKSENANDRVWNFYFSGDNNDQLTMYVSEDGGWTNRGFRRADDSLSAGVWYHLAGTWDTSGTFNVYVDGVSVPATNSGAATSMNSNGEPVIIGSNPFSQGSYFNGNIDDVRIYNRVLGADEIRRLANLPPPPSGLVGYWNFDGDVSDSSGNSNDGSWSGSTTNRYVSGYNGLAGTFNGSDDYLQVGHNASLAFDDANPFTIAVWVKQAQSQTDKYILVKGEYSGSYDYNYKIITKVSGAFAVTISNNSSAQQAYNTGTYSLDWHHLVMSFNGSDSCGIYIDGTYLNAISVASVYSGTERLSLGAIWRSDTSAWVDFFTGSIDEVHIYNRALSATEVEELYTYGRVKSGGM